MAHPILDENSQLTPEAADLILKQSSIIPCECPRHLLKILESVRKFKDYEKSCIVNSPQDRETHEWLEAQAEKFDSLLSLTISDLAYREGMVDTNNEILPPSKS